MGKFESLTIASPNEIYSLTARFNADNSARKVNLGVGAYKTNEGKPFIFEAVSKAEEKLLNERSNHEYLPISGLGSFYTAARDMLFGSDFEASKEGKIASAQCVSGTGALRVVGEFLFKHCSNAPKILISDPTWENHHKIFQETGLGDKIQEYRYFHATSKGVDFEGMIEDMKKSPNNSIILLHTCAHNPTGVDLSKDQWKLVLSLCIEKSFLPLFDTAYHGFVSGNLEEDGFSLRLFAEAKVELIVCQSFAKNMGLYGERCGAVHFLTSSPLEAKAVTSNLEIIIRPMYSSPPKHGAAIASTILNNPDLYSLWSEELKSITARIASIRQSLYEELLSNGAPGTWDHVIAQKGMFTFTGLSERQSIAMVEEHHVYMLKSGRISVAGLGTSNVSYVAAAIKQVCLKYP